MKSRYALFAVLAAVLPSIGYTQKSAPPKPEKVQLEMKAPSTKAETVAKLVKGLGKVDARWGTTFLIELKKGIDADTAIAKLQHAPGVRSVHEDDGDVAMSKQERGNERYGIKDARKFWYEQRAYPKGYIDTAAYIRAAKHRDQDMAPATITSARSSAPTTPATWTFLGPKNMGGAVGTNPWSGRVNGVAYAPGSSSTIYLASASGGVWKTTDSGVNWTPLSDSWPFMYTTCVKVNPSNANIVYAGTGDFDGDYSINGFSFGCGVMKSTDAGATWTSLGTSSGFGNYAISDIIIDPETTSTITICEGRGHADSSFTGAGFIWRSTDSGATWTKVLNVNKSWSKMSVSAISGGIRFYYAISQDGTLYKSADRGATWALVTTPLPANGQSIDRICAHPTNQQVAYLLDSDNAQVYKTTNAGTTWSTVTSNLANSWGQAWYDSYIGVSSVSGNDWVVVGAIDVSLSANGGTTWADVGQVYGPGTPQLHPDQHCIAFDPNDATSGVIGCDGGIYHFNYNSGTSTFTGSSLNANLYLTELYNADIHPSNANIVLSGAQDNATQYSRNGNLATWEIEIGGDGGYCGINWTNTQIQYGSYVFATIYKTTDEWVSTLTQIQSQQSGSAFLAPFILDPNAQNLLYSAAGFGLNQYNSNTSTWSNHLGGVNLTNNYILGVAIAPSNSNTIYTAAVDGQVWMSTNQGASWTQINGGSPALPNAAATSVAVNPTNPNDVLVGFSGTGNGHIYRCTNTAAGPGRVWTNLTGTLPDIPLNAIAIDPAVAGSWYVGTDVGVFSTTDSGTTWTNMTNPNGLPNVQVNTLKIRASDRKMYAATWGRGVWEIQLPNPSIVKNITVAPSQITSGNTGNGTVNLWQNAASNTVVNLSSNNAAASVPATATVLSGQSSANFTVNTSNATYSSINATITESLASDPNHQFVVKVAPNNRASFVSQTVPSSMVAGQSYPVSLVFTNAGGTTWDFATHQFELGSTNPYNNNTWGMNRIPLQTASVAPSANGTFTATVIAPMTGGTYNFQWQPYEGTDGTFFGQTSTNVAVTVTKLADAARYISRVGPTTVSCGQDFTVQNTMMNVGTNTWTNAGGYHEVSVAPYANTTWTIKNLFMPANSSIAPGAQVTMTGLCTAPITPGTYTMQWSTDHNGVTFGDRPPLLNITVNLGPDDSQLISSTMPASMGPGVVLSATITMKNLGGATWDSTYSLVATGGNNFNVASIPVTGTVAPNTNFAFTANFTAPASPGTYTWQMRMQHNTTKFGQPTALLSVVVAADAAQYISRTGPTTVNAGQDFYVQNTFKNTGTTTWSTGTGYSMMTVNPNNDAKWVVTRGYLASGSIAPLGSGTFTGLATAPFTPGTYSMQWQMNKSGAPFGEKSPLLNITVTLGADDAQFVSQTGVPTTIVHGTTFNATITMKNLGTATWTGPTYNLKSIGSNTFGIASINAVSTAQNANDAFSATFTAPVTPGTYTFQMRMEDGTTKFGQAGTKVTITVT